MAQLAQLVEMAVRKIMRQGRVYRRNQVAGLLSEVVEVAEHIDEDVSANIEGTRNTNIQYNAQAQAAARVAFGELNSVSGFAPIYMFTYAEAYLNSDSPAVSLTLPKRRAPYERTDVFPFFVSLLAEGNLAQEQCRRLQIDEADLFGRLLQTAGGDVIGSITVEAVADD